MTSTVAITVERMQELVEQERAHPLLEACFPVPVELDGQWWHVPAESPPGADPDAFVLAPPVVADELARLAARWRAADEAVRRGGGSDLP